MKSNTQSLSATDVVANILKSKGNFVKAFWKSKVKSAAAYKHILLEKYTSAVVRAGMEYANIDHIKEAIENGERDEPGPLPWGEWKIVDGKSMYPYIIEHKGEDYIRLYPSNANNHIPNVKYFVDGEEVEKSEFAKYLTPSDAKKLLERTEEDKPDCFTLKKSNILGTEDWNEV